MSSFRLKNKTSIAALKAISDVRIKMKVNISTSLSMKPKAVRDNDSQRNETS